MLYPVELRAPVREELICEGTPMRQPGPSSPQGRVRVTARHGGQALTGPKRHLNHDSRRRVMRMSSAGAFTRKGNQFPTPFETMSLLSPRAYSPDQYRKIAGPNPTCSLSINCPPSVWPDNVSGMPASAAASNACG